MRILSFSYCFPNEFKPTWGVFIAQRLSAFSKKENIELEVCAPIPTFPVLSTRFGNLPTPTEKNRGLNVYHPRYFYLPKLFKQFDGLFYAKGLFPWAKKYCELNQPEIFDAHFAWPDGVGVYHLSKKLGIPYVLTLRGWIWVGMKQPKLWKQAVEGIRNAEAVICLCQAMVDVCKEIGCDENRLHIIHNGVDRKIFRPMDRQEARKQLGLPQNVPVVVVVAYFQRRKGILETVKATAQLPSDTHLLLVGAPTEADYYEEVKRTIEELGLSDRVIIPGHQAHDKLPVFYNAANVTVLASYWEGSPNAVLESLGCGTPVVATPVGSVPEQITPGKNGYIVPMKDHESLAHTLNEVLSRDWNQDTIVSSVMNWDQVADKVKSVFCNI